MANTLFRSPEHSRRWSGTRWWSGICRFAILADPHVGKCGVDSETDKSVLLRVDPDRLQDFARSMRGNASVSVTMTDGGASFDVASMREQTLGV
jgi:hypothetical protein